MQLWWYKSPITQRSHPFIHYYLCLSIISSFSTNFFFIHLFIYLSIHVHWYIYIICFGKYLFLVISQFYWRTLYFESVFMYSLPRFYVPIYNRHQNIYPSRHQILWNPVKPWDTRSKVLSALKFNWRLGSTAPETTFKFQGETFILTSNSVASTLR